MNDYSLQLDDVHFTYPDGTVALNAVSFKVESGEAVALIGPNGAGKSTLLLRLTGFHHAQRGTICVNDLLLTRETAPLVRKAIGLVFQHPDDQLFMPTVEEDVAFGPRQAGHPEGEVEAAVETALERVGALHLKDRLPYRLSAGEKRSVAMAAVLAMQPDILVMDEPTTHLDPRARRRLIALLQSLHHTRLIATHDLEMVVEVCSRVILLDGGRVIADGPSRDILNNEPLMLAHGLERPHILNHPHPHPPGT